jgi:hypothetical protein
VNYSRSILRHIMEFPMLESRLLAHERAYRGASQAFDYCVIGVSSLLLVSSVFSIGAAPPLAVSNVLALTALLLFALSLIAGLRKLEYYVVILGTNYSLSQAEGERGVQATGSSSRVLSQLHETIQHMSNRASRSKLQP